jgi:hypothetical protein
MSKNIQQVYLNIIGSLLESLIKNVMKLIVQNISWYHVS